MPKIAEKPRFQTGAMVEVRKDNESVPVYKGKLRCFEGCGGKSYTKRPKTLAILRGICQHTAVRSRSDAIKACIWEMPAKPNLHLKSVSLN